MEKTKILTIAKIKLSEKWVEFFFEEEKAYSPIWSEDYEIEIGKEETFLHCCKQYVLFDLVDFEFVLNSGLKGLRSTWKLDNYGQYVLDSIERV